MAAVDVEDNQLVVVDNAAKQEDVPDIVADRPAEVAASTQISRINAMMFARLIESVQANLTAGSEIAPNVGYSKIEETVASADFSVRVIDKIPKRLEVIHDVESRYAVLRTLPAASITFNCYNDWICEYIRVVVETIDSMKCVYKLEGKETVNDRRIYKLGMLGFDENILSGNLDTLPGIVAGLTPLRTPTGNANYKFENVHVASLPCLAECHRRSQELILDADIEPHRLWMEDFCERKKFVR